MKRQKKKDLLLLATKLIEKIPGASNTKEYYQSCLKNKNKKSLKRSKIVTQRPKTLKNPNKIDIRSVTIEHPKTSHESSKTMRQAEKVSQEHNAGKNANSPLCKETTTSDKLLDEKNVKITKRLHA